MSLRAGRSLARFESKEREILDGERFEGGEKPRDLRFQHLTRAQDRQTASQPAPTARDDDD